MSDIQSAQSDNSRLLGAEVLFLLPDKILTDEKFDVRPYNGRDDQEAKRIEEMARAIEQVGQQEAGIVIPGKRDGDFTLIAGHRRRRAITLINQQLSEAGKPLMRMRVIVDRTPGDPRRKAIINNLHRKNNSPMELAELIKRVEADNNWPETAMASHKKAAEYLGVSPAQITQHLRLLKLDKATQAAIHSGEISKQSAFDMINEKLDSADQREVILRGRANQTAAIAVESKSTEEFEKKVAVKGNKVEHPHVKKAITEVKAAKGESVTLKKSKADIVEFFEEMDGPAYGANNSAVRIFARYFVDEWVPGTGSDKKLSKLFDAATAGSDKGKEEPAKEKPVAAKFGSGLPVKQLKPKVEVKVPVKPVTAKATAKPAKSIAKAAKAAAAKAAAPAKKSSAATATAV